MRRKKEIQGIAALLGVCILFVLSGQIQQGCSGMQIFTKEKDQATRKFDDVEADTYCYQGVNESVALGYMNGYSDGRFGPGDKLTRCQLAQVLYNGYSQEFIGTNTQYRDIFRGEWYAAAVAWVNHYGLMDGYSAESFQPDLPILWEQLIWVLHQLAGEPKSWHPLGYLLDYWDISRDARAAYSWALDNGIITAPGNCVHPQNEVTRGELAQLLPAYNDYIRENGYQEPVQEIPELDGMTMEKLFFKREEFEPYNNELQDYLPEQVEFTRSGAAITAVDMGDGIYHSGQIQSNVSFRYGVFEFTFNNLEGQGYWPAIWMLPDSQKTRFPELDIYEMVGKEPNQLYGTLHYFDREASLDSHHFTYRSNEAKFGYKQNEIPEKSTIRLEWTEDALVWIFNGQEVQRITENIPDNYMYLIINLAIGGDWPGDPVAETEFPVKFQVEITRFEPEQVKYRGD